MSLISKYFWTEFWKLFTLETVKKKKKVAHMQQTKKYRNAFPTLSNVWQDKIISALFLTLKEQQFLEGVNIQLDSQSQTYCHDLNLSSLKTRKLLSTWHCNRK